MRGAHLTAEELEALLAGEAGQGVQEHVSGCTVCQQELAKWHQFLGTGSHWLPDDKARRRVRHRALTQAVQGKPLRWWVPLAAAAALVVAIGVATQWGGKPETNVDAVLEEVDTTLASDPLLALADGYVVRVVVPEATSGERSES